MLSLRIAATALLVLGLTRPVLAQQSAEPLPAAEPNKSAVESSSNAQSGYQDVPEFGGPNSVGATLREDDAVKEATVFRFEGIQRGLKPYFDWKGRVNEKHGLAFGLDYTALYQAANESPGKDDAGSGILRLFGTWTALGRDSGNTGSASL